VSRVFAGVGMEEYGHYAMMYAYRTGYFHGFLLRCLDLLPVPVALVYAGHRLCASSRWRWLEGGRIAFLSVASGRLRSGGCPPHRRRVPLYEIQVPLRGGA